MPRKIIEVENLWYKYPKADRPALCGINLQVEEGEFLAIMGKTGAGKTTLCLSFNGLIPQYFEGGEYSGKVIVNGLLTSNTPPQKIALHLGMVFQDFESQIFGTIVEEDVAFGPLNLGLSRDEIIRRVSYSLSALRLEGYEKRETDTLSGGEKQRLALAGVFAMKPKILVLDEPTSQLDSLGKEEVFSSVARLREDYKTTIIMVEHRSEEIAKYADRVIIMSDGKIALEGSPREVFSKVAYLLEKGVRPPQVCELAFSLTKRGFSSKFFPITEDEFIFAFPKLSIKKSSTCSNIYQDKEEMIVIEDLHYIYPNNVKALNGISLTIKKGEIVAIIGQNGSGKTTLAKHLIGLLKPTFGKVLIKGLDTREQTTGKLAKIVGYVFQNPDHQIFATSVKDEISYGLKNLKLPKEEIEKRVSESLKFVGLEGFENYHPFLLKKGERQRVAFASIFAMKPEIFVVDEPTTGQDYIGSENMMHMLLKLNENGHTIIIITHDMRIVGKYVKRVIVIDKGKIVLDGSTKQVFSEFDTLRRCYLLPPQITRIGRELSFKGEETILTVEDMLSRLGN
ncbi:MAG: energy-coupling factor transporter ATPase [Nitrososphaerales archaeon]